MKESRYKLVLFAIMMALLLVTVTATLFGSANIKVSDFGQIILSRIPLIGSRFSLENISTAHQTIVLNLRLPRVMLALLAGVGLSLAGVVFQGTFSNPMAEPYLLGVSSGAAFGATIAAIMNIQISLLGFGGMSIFAFAGALLVVFLIFRVALVQGELPMSVLLLAGLSINYFFSSLIALLMTLHQDKLESVYFWTMGSFRLANWNKVMVVGTVVLFSYIYVTRRKRELDLLLLGDEQAKSLGVEVARVKRELLVIASLMTATIVAASGIIGFVGLIIPHSARLVVGPKHNRLLVLSAIMGAIFLVLADTIARSILSNRELSIGIITSLCGVPFFLVHLFRNRRSVG